MESIDNPNGCNEINPINMFQRDIFKNSTVIVFVVFSIRILLWSLLAVFQSKVGCIHRLITVEKMKIILWVM